MQSEVNAGNASGSSGRFAASLLACALLAACVSNPYIAPTRPEVSAAQGSATARLESAFVYANRTQDAYAAKASEEFERQKALSGALIVLGAATLGLAAYDVHRDVLIGAALLGGTGYTLGTWNANQGRLGIYLEGRKAIACAKAVVSPLRMTQDQLDALRTEMAETARITMEASEATGDVTRWLAAASSGDESAKGAAQVELAVAIPVLAKAADLLAQGASLDRRVGQAGSSLDNRVDEIVRLVDSALNGTLADLSALPKVIAGLGNSINLFVPGLDLDATLAARSKAKSSGTPIPLGALEGRGGGSDASRVAAARDASAELARATGRLAARLDYLKSTRLPLLSGRVEPMTTSAVKEALVGCGFETGTTGAALKLDRKAISFAPGKASTSIVTISGGTSPYSASFVDLPATGLSVSVPAGGKAVVVVADTTTVADTAYVLSVRDATETAVNLQVAVSAKDAPVPKPPTNKAGPAKDKKQEAAAPATTTDAAIQSCPEFGGKTIFECGLHPEQIAGVRKRLLGPETPMLLDDELREQIRKFQLANKCSSTNGILDGPTLAKIQGKPDARCT